VEVDVRGAGDYIPKADAKIRIIKERYQSIKNGLPQSLPVMIKEQNRKIHSNLPECGTKGAFHRVASGFLQGIWIGIW
jgi:hypothetical protein